MAVASRTAGEVEVERLDVSAYTVPTDEPESDGTLEWDATTLISSGGYLSRSLMRRGYPPAFDGYGSACESSNQTVVELSPRSIPHR